MAGLMDPSSWLDIAKGAGQTLGNHVENNLKNAYNRYSFNGTLPQDLEKERGLLSFGNLSNQLTPSGLESHLGGLLGTFGTPKALNAPLDALKEAHRLEAQGVDPEQIWHQTGWAVNTPDHIPRFEIDDSQGHMIDDRPFMHEMADMAQSKRNWNEYGQHMKALKDYIVPHQSTNLVNVDQVLSHPEYARHYPQIYGRMRYQMKPDDSPQTGGFSPKSVAMKSGPGSAEDVHSVMTHEMQHAIQHNDGTAKGGNPKRMMKLGLKAHEDYKNNSQVIRSLRKLLKTAPPEDLAHIRNNIAELQHKNNLMSAIRPWAHDPFNSYQNLAGEAEARLAQHRLNLTPEERRNTYPFNPAYFKKATGSDLNDLIVRGADSYLHPTRGWLHNRHPLDILQEMEQKGKL